MLVGAPGFEPGTSCAQGKRATRLRYAPNNLITNNIAQFRVFGKVQFRIFVLLLLQFSRRTPTTFEAASRGVCRQGFELRFEN